MLAPQRALAVVGRPTSPALPPLRGQAAGSPERPPLSALPDATPTAQDVDLPTDFTEEPLVQRFPSPNFQAVNGG